MELYPLKFNPIFSYRIWGGEKLKTVLNKTYNADSIGESWEISDIEDSETLVAHGPLKNKSIKQLIAHYKSDFLGKKVYESFGLEFPLLIKFIDAKTPLSIQVHPDNALAKQRHDSFGKNEMWYVMQADQGAELIVGFKTQTNKETYLEHVNNGKLTTILNNENVKKGDTYYIPAGRVHAIGAGVLLAEIQQKSDITYRIYDYDRVDKKTGKTRALHTQQAIDAIDYNFENQYKTDYITKKNNTTKLVHSPYFTTNIIDLNGSVNKDYSKTDSFVIYMCVEGELQITHNQKNYQLHTGETILLPALLNKIELKSTINTRILEVYLD